jgi:hypothetical protein
VAEPPKDSSESEILQRMIDQLRAHGHFALADMLQAKHFGGHQEPSQSVAQQQQQRTQPDKDKLDNK